MAKQVLIIGLGLIGGSVALAIRNGNNDIHITGYDLNTEQLELAKALGVINESVSSLDQEIAKMDYIVVATPVVQSEQVFEALLKQKMKKNSIVTDVGSTKEHIMKYTEDFLHKDVFLIGGHPMAGSHKSGVAASNDHLFENAIYVITSSSKIPRDRIEELKNLLIGTKANFIDMTPSMHDEMVGLISHFPHIIASSLVHLVKNSRFDDHDLKRMAAGGFRDITRIASSNPIMWRDIFLHNKRYLIELMEAWEHEMETIKAIIESQSSLMLYDYFNNAKIYRDDLPEKKKGAIPSFFDLYIDVKDEPGAIANVTNMLASNKINLTNIRIIETREDIMGVLCLSFRSDDDREQAYAKLSSHHYICYLADESK
jgi:prephenate dehydrogenase